MKMKYAAVASICVLAVLCSSASVLFASDSDADAAVYDGYYKNQLSSGQKTVYNALAGLSTDVAFGGDESSGYYIAVTAVDLDDDPDTAKKDIETAWMATKLDASETLKWSFWTWTVSGVKPNITDVTAGPGGSFHIGIDAAFKDGFADKVTAVTEAVNAKEISGNSDSEKVKSINSILTGKDYAYVDSNESHAFANTIYAAASANIQDGKTHMTSVGYAAMFKALCTKAGIASIQVYGFSGNDSKLFAWNEVLVDDKVYGVDCAANATSKNKEQWLCAGVYTTADGDAFSKVHKAFPQSTVNGLVYEFKVETLNNNGYSWPADNSLIAKITEYAPWILVGIICIVMAVALVYMAKRGD
ncbi:MAG: hypothetical protein J5945_02595 [Candidatus Methanomethylophilus sp.]|nr:hypothetical protein [Methanomethylophilus sp.]